MKLDEVIAYCLNKPGAWTDFPFDENTMVIKTGPKMFCLIGSENSNRINLKCDPGRAIALRAEHPAITPGYHMNKKHWNTILIGKIESQLITELIDHSYELVFNNLSNIEKITIVK